MFKSNVQLYVLFIYRAFLYNTVYINAAVLWMTVRVSVVLLVLPVVRVRRIYECRTPQTRGRERAFCACVIMTGTSDAECVPFSP